MSQASACSLKDARVCAIDAELQAYTHGHPVTYQENSTTVPSIAAESEWVLGGNDIIHLGDTAQFDENELRYLLAHEFGHSVHRDGRAWLESVATPEDRSMPDLPLLTKYSKQVANAVNNSRELNHKLEFDADAFAVGFMNSLHKDPVEAMRGVLKNDFSSANHPSRRSRINKAKEVLASLQVASAAVAVSH